MARRHRFTFLCDANERRLLTALADHLHRNQSDAIRWLICESSRELGIDRETTEVSTLMGDVHASS